MKTYPKSLSLREATQARQRPRPSGARLWSRQVLLWGQEARPLGEGGVRG